MKHVILFAILIISMIWYVGVGQEHYRNNVRKDQLSVGEINQLHKEGKIKKPDFEKGYVAKTEVRYIYKRTLVPFVYERDTIYDSGVTYYTN